MTGTSTYRRLASLGRRVAVDARVGEREPGGGEAVRLPYRTTVALRGHAGTGPGLGQRADVEHEFDSAVGRLRCSRRQLSRSWLQE